LKTQLLAVDPPGELVDQYLRSRPLLWQRLDTSIWEQLQLAVKDKEGAVLISKLSDSLPAFQEALRELPPQIVMSGQSTDTVYFDATERVRSIHWGGWTPEPIGSGWPVGQRYFDVLDDSLGLSRKLRPSISSLIRSNVFLAAFLYELERLCDAQRYRTALELVPQILECHANLLGEKAVSTDVA